MRPRLTRGQARHVGAGRGAIPGHGLPPPIFEGVLLGNPHIKYADATNRGYTVIDVTPERTSGTWIHYARVDSPQAPAPLSAPEFSVRSGENHLVSET